MSREIEPASIPRYDAGISARTTQRIEEDKLKGKELKVEKE